MANLEPIDASVLAATGASLSSGIAGETIVQGDVLYADSTDGGDLKLADSSALLTAAVVGIALNAAADKQPVEYIKSGTLTLGAGSDPPAAGEPYFLSTTAGKIDDVVPANSQYATVLGIGIGATTMKVGIVVSGVQKSA